MELTQTLRQSVHAGPFGKCLSTVLGAGTGRERAWARLRAGHRGHSGIPCFSSRPALPTPANPQCQGLLSRCTEGHCSLSGDVPSHSPLNLSLLSPVAPKRELSKTVMREKKDEENPTTA